MSDRDQFHITRRIVGQGGSLDLATEAAPADLGAVCRWIRRQMDLVTLVVSVRRDDSVGIGLLCTNWPRPLLERSLAERWYDNDAIGDMARRRQDVLRPADIRAHASGDETTAARAAARAQYDLPIPTIVPVWQNGRCVGCVSFGRHVELSREEEAVARFLAPPLLARFHEHFQARAIAAISPRERECLVWAGAGKTARETGTILDVSEHTVVAHLRNAGHKLGATNRLQAVAEAIRLGLIR